MPGSLWHTLSAALSLIHQIHPRSILDLGVGFGKWGFLCREQLDILEERYSRADWDTVIEGIEGYKEYENPVYGFCYDGVYFGEILETLPRLGHYDLIIMGDVIEHFPKEQGYRLLEEARRHGTYLLIVTPNVFVPNAVDIDNPLELHRSLWTVDDFLTAYPCLYREFLGSSLVLIFGEGALARWPGPLARSLTRGLYKWRRLWIRLPMVRLVANSALAKANKLRLSPAERQNHQEEPDVLVGEGRKGMTEVRR